VSITAEMVAAMGLSIQVTGMMTTTCDVLDPEMTPSLPAYATSNNGFKLAVVAPA
jgi:hypothetical protein